MDDAIEFCWTEKHLKDEIQRVIKARVKAVLEGSADTADLEKLCHYQGVIHGWWGENG